MDAMKKGWFSFSIDRHLALCVVLVVDPHVVLLCLFLRRVCLMNKHEMLPPDGQDEPVTSLDRAVAPKHSFDVLQAPSH